MYVYRQNANGTYKLHPLTLNWSFWEQNVSANSVLVLNPISRLLHLSLKDALSAAVFSGWLQPITASPSAMALKKGSKSLTVRSTSSRRKQLFFVLRQNVLFAYKSDSKADRAEYVILMDYYRVEKKEWDAGFVLRFDQKISGFATGSTMVHQLHSGSESDVDGWLGSINLIQREPTEVFGATLRQVANRASNRNEHCPDHLFQIVDQIEMRIRSDSERYRCLLAADARPPPELTKLVFSAKLPNLQSHPDTAIAAALRAYLIALPEPLSSVGLTAMLTRAHQSQDLKLAGSAISLNSDIVHATCFKMVLSVLVLAPVAQLDKVSEMFADAVFGSGADSKLLEFLLANFDSVFNAAIMSATKTSAPIEATQAGAYATVLFKFEGRNVKELSVNEGDAVCIFRESGTGWSQVSRMSDGMTGAVPTSYLSRNGDPSIDASTLAGPREPVPLFSPRTPSEVSDVGRMFTHYESFEVRAVQALEDERIAKERILEKIILLEQEQLSRSP